MPRSHKGHKYILCIIDEVTNFLITLPIFHAKSEEVGEALLEHVITKYCIPEYIIMDQASAFMSSLMTYLFHRLDIKIKTIAPFNHQDRENFWYRGGDLVYIISPLTSQLRTNSQKIAVKYVAPVVVYKIVDPHNYLLMTLD